MVLASAIATENCSVLTGPISSPSCPRGMISAARSGVGILGKRRRPPRSRRQHQVHALVAGLREHPAGRIDPVRLDDRLSDFVALRDQNVNAIPPPTMSVSQTSRSVSMTPSLSETCCLRVWPRTAAAGRTASRSASRPRAQGETRRRQAAARRPPRSKREPVRGAERVVDVRGGQPQRDDRRKPVVGFLTPSEGARLEHHHVALSHAEDARPSLWSTIRDERDVAARSSQGCQRTGASDTAVRLALGPAEMADHDNRAPLSASNVAWAQPRDAGRSSVTTRRRGGR